MAPISPKLVPAFLSYLPDLNTIEYYSLFACCGSSLERHAMDAVGKRVGRHLLAEK